MQSLVKESFLCRSSTRCISVLSLLLSHFTLNSKLSVICQICLIVWQMPVFEPVWRALSYNHLRWAIKAKSLELELLLLLGTFCILWRFDTIALYALCLRHHRGLVSFGLDIEGHFVKLTVLHDQLRINDRLVLQSRCPHGSHWTRRNGIDSGLATRPLAQLIVDELVSLLWFLFCPEHIIEVERFLVCVYGSRCCTCLAMDCLLGPLNNLSSLIYEFVLHYIVHSKRAHRFW